MPATSKSSPRDWPYALYAGGQPQPPTPTTVAVQTKQIFQAAIEIATTLARSAATLPLRVATRRDPQQWVVIGRDDGRFVDNVKYFFCWLHTHPPAGTTITFVSEDQGTVEQLLGYGAKALLFPNDHAHTALLRAGTVIIDNNHPFQRGLLEWFRGARVVQLWHGAPLKEIELSLHRRRLSRLGKVKGLLASVQSKLTNAYPRIDVLVSPSTFYTKHVFAPCFNAKEVFEAGYSRNDLLLSPELFNGGLFYVNVDQDALHRLVQHRRRGGRVLLYAPTYRDDLRSPFEDGGIDLSAWALSAKRHNYLVALKLHPEMLGKTPSLSDDVFVNIDASSDIYPLLRQADLLVTDYSSIYFDYLLLDRPIIFYPYDLHQFISEGRPLIFDYGSMTPGPKARTFTDLLGFIDGTLKTGWSHEWESERHRVRDLVFDHVDNLASERIWTKLSEQEDRTR